MNDGALCRVLSLQSTKTGSVRWVAFEGDTMATDIISATQRDRLRAYLTQVPFERLVWAAAMMVLVIVAYLKNSAGLTLTFRDADDAARLLQVREFMAGAPWFDTQTYAMGGNAGMLSHWSRLIDLPLAALIAMFSLFVSTPTAEAMTLMVWPMVVLAPLVWVVISTSAKKAGAYGAAIAALLTVLCPLALYQFSTGRIDHHNVMIAATVSAALLMWSHPTSVRHWQIAGALCGLAVAVGYEALAPVVAIIAGAGLGGLLDKTAARPAQHLTLAFMLTFAACFVLTIPPSEWLAAKCDAISLNLVALSTIGGVGLVTALSFGRSWPLTARLALIAFAGVAGLTVFAALEPKCLAGPMGQLPSELKTVWLNYVAEGRSIVGDFFKGNLEQSLGLITFFALGVAAQYQAARTSRSAADVVFLGLLVTLVMLASWQYKYISYASFVVIAPLAIAIARLGPIGEVSAPTVRLTAAAIMSQAVIIHVSGMIDERLALAPKLSTELRANAKACRSTAALKDLQDLSPGLVSAHIDIGAYLATLTPLRVLSAPYHRIPNAILANNHILESRDDEDAKSWLQRERVDYIILCDGLDEPSADKQARRGTLRSRLIANDVPDYLARVPLSNPQSMYNVWRVIVPTSPQL